MLFHRFNFKNFDWWLLGLVGAITLIGFATVYSASESLGLGGFYFYRQIVWVALGCLVLLVTVYMGFRFFCKFGWAFHIGAVLLLILTLVHGTGNNFSDVRRWIQIGPFTFQASELAKLTVVLTLAHFFRESPRYGKFSFFRLLFLAVVVLVPFLLIAKQPDLGSAMLYLVTCLVMIFYGGMPYKWILAVTLLLLVASPLVWKYGLKDYQRDRITTVLNGSDDKLGKGYHINQSVIAIGSGGILGKGYLKGSQAQLNFLPARHTDFIFALYAEEWGFVGSMVLLILYLLLIFALIKPIGIYRYATSNLVTVGIATIITSHILINLGMVNKLLPVVGVPLPFMSYGGSAMISLMFGLGLVMSIRSWRFEEMH